MSTPKIRHMELVWLALALRLQPWLHLPKYAIVGVELMWLGAFYWINRAHLRDFYLRFEKPLRLLALGFLVGIVWSAIEVGWDRANGFYSPFYWNSVIYLPIALVVVAWASSLYEELLFRSCMLWYFSGILSKPRYAVLAQGALFFIAHGSRYFQSGHWHQAVVTGAFGLLLGGLTLRTKSVVPAWVAHAFSNSYAVIFIPPDMLLERIFSSWVK
jgi:membrane protease YdiL (CAAX protease family)